MRGGELAVNLPVWVSPVKFEHLLILGSPAYPNIALLTSYPSFQVHITSQLPVPRACSHALVLRLKCSVLTFPVVDERFQKGQL